MHVNIRFTLSNEIKELKLVSYLIQALKLVKDHLRQQQKC